MRIKKLLLDYPKERTITPKKVPAKEAQKLQRELQDTKHILIAQLKQRGLPEPETEVQAVPGRKWRFDLGWPLWKPLEWRDGYKGPWLQMGLLVEVQGVGRHQQVWRKDGYENDLEKSNAAQLEGWTVLAFSSRQVKSGEAVDFLEGIL